MNPTLKKYIAIALCAIAVFVVGKIIVSAVHSMSQTGVTPGVIARLVFDDGATLASSADRTNVLVLGIGGGTHEGADLTDSIMVLSLNNKTKTTAMISVPRDIWSDNLKDKINSAYHYGEQKQKGGGLILAKATIEDVIGMPIQYAMVIDFSGFMRLIDEVGGVDVNVSRAFTDTEYPIPGKELTECPGDEKNACRYETVHFDAGVQHMDGARALIYSRSRHAEGAEGSDFARSKRQQDIMIALKDRLVHPTGWFTFSRFSAIPKVVDDATDMDLNMAQILTIGKRFMRVNVGDIQKITFEDQLDNPPSSLYNNLYVLVPHESWEEIQGYIKTQLK